MAEVVRTIDTPRGPLLVTVQRVADRYTTRELTADDLLQAARALFREAALVSQQARRPAPEAATVGEEFFANARVLAAAKDLYEACEKARNVLALIETFDELIRTPRRRFEEAIDAIDLALLKARGESDGN